MASPAEQTGAPSPEVLSAGELTVLVRALQVDLAQVRVDVRALEGARDGITAGAATAIAGLAAEMHALSESMAGLPETVASQGKSLASQGESLAMLVAVNAATADLQEFVREEFDKDRTERAATAAREQQARERRQARDKQHRRWAINGYRLVAGVSVPTLAAILLLLINNAAQRLSTLPPLLYAISTGVVLVGLAVFISIFLIFFRPPDLDDGPEGRSSDNDAAQVSQDAAIQGQKDSP